MRHLLSSASAGDARMRTTPVPAAGILHLGLGNFHRAHQAVYTDAALRASGGDWGIVGVSSRSAAVVNAMHAQAQRYTVVEISPDGATFSVPRVHTDSYVGAADPARVIADIADPRIRIVTITVTENGYTYSPATGGLNLADPTVLHDLSTPEAPRSVIGQLARGLQRRMHAGAEPITIQSCDNLADNGRHTELLLREFVAHLPAADASELDAYLTAAVSFPSSMVDRIVPATTDHYRSLVTDALGYEDSIPVPAEPFTMWVMEDDFAGGRPDWAAGGAVFSKEVAGYEQLKMRLLNGTHSLIAYLGALSGKEIIPASVAQSWVESAAHSVLRGEYLPTVSVPSEVDVDAYEQQLFSRWRNTALGHRTSQVGSDGSVKLRQRIPEPAIASLQRGAMPQHLALTVAGYLTCLAPLNGFDPGANAASMQDPAREELARAASESHNGRQLAAHVLGERHLLGQELAEYPAFHDRVGEYIDILHTHGPQAAAREATTTTVTADVRSIA